MVVNVRLNSVEMKALRSTAGVTEGLITKQCDKRALWSGRCSDSDRERDA